MRIRNRKTYFTTLPEGSAPENKKKKFSTILYFCFLFSIVLYILFYIGMKLLYIERKGIVEVERHLVSSRIEGTVEKIYVDKGDRVKYLQHVSKIRPALDAPSTSGIRPVLEGNEDLGSQGQSIPVTITDRLLKLDNEIRLTDIELKTARENYKLLQAEVQQEANDNFRNRLLELNNDPKKQARQDSRLHKAALKIESLRAIRQSLQQYKADILANTENSLNPSQGTGKNRVFFSGYGGLVQSPVNGTVHKVFKTAGAQVFPGDSLLAVRPVNGQIAVHGFFKADQVAYIQKGKTVDITFPDNTTSTGVIGNHYAAAESYREKLREDYVPVKPEILVEILPAETVNAETWLRYDRMTVDLRIRK